MAPHRAAEPSSQGGIATALTHKICIEMGDRSEKICVRKSLAYIKVNGERRGEAPGTGAEVLLEPMENMMKLSVPLLYLKDHVAANVHSAAH